MVVGAVVLVAIVCKVSESAYIEFPFGEPMANVVALIERLQVESGVVFDLLDWDLWEPIEGGFRVHGMFLDSIIGVREG